jgi:hypothetical protein
MHHLIRLAIPLNPMASEPCSETEHSDHNIITLILLSFDENHGESEGNEAKNPEVLCSTA